VPLELPVPARRVVFVGMARAPTKAVAATKSEVKETMLCAGDVGKLAGEAGLESQRPPLAALYAQETRVFTHCEGAMIVRGTNGESANAQHGTMHSKFERADGRSWWQRSPCNTDRGARREHEPKRLGGARSQHCWHVGRTAQLNAL
jgi:hypothetical protein